MRGDRPVANLKRISYHVVPPYARDRPMNGYTCYGNRPVPPYARG